VYIFDTDVFFPTFVLVLGLLCYLASKYYLNLVHLHSCPVQGKN